MTINKIKLINIWWGNGIEQVWYGSKEWHNSLGQGTGVEYERMPHPSLQLKEVESLLSHPSQYLCII